MEYVIGTILILAALFLIGAVLMQSGKAHNLSGTIAGGAETFFGKSKASTIDKKLSRATTIVSIVFVILVLVFYVSQNAILGLDRPAVSADADSAAGQTVVTPEVTADEAAEAVVDAAEEAEGVNG